MNIQELVKKYQFIFLKGLVILMFFWRISECHRGLTFNSYFVWVTLLHILFFICLPFYTINVLKKVIKKESLSQASKSIIVFLMIIFLYFLLYGTIVIY